MPTAPTAILLALASTLAPTLNAAGSYSVFRSADGGRTWSRSNSGLPTHARINAFVATATTYFAGTDDGLRVSRDQGVSWAPATQHLGRVLALAAQGGSLLAGTDGNGLAVSRDGGATWAPSGTARFAKVRALLAHEGVVYAGTDAEGVFLSRDSGFSWTPLGAGLPRGAQVFSLAGLPGRVFAGLYGKGLFVLQGPADRWRRVGDDSPLALATAGSTLLAGRNPGGIFLTDDSGGTWVDAMIAPSDDLGKAPVWELAATPAFALAGIANGVYRSEDHGRHWMRATAGLPPRAAGIAFLLTPRVLLVAVFLPAGQ